MAGLVILIITAVIFLARLNPYLASILISGIIGYGVTSLLLKHAHCPGWVLPAGILFWVFTASPHIASFLAAVIPPRRRKQ